ncbi:MAG: hypothetical protein ACLQU2_13835 [Candidatus Binataceae bacterium]
MAFVLQINRFFETIGNRSAESRRMRSLVDLLIAQNGPEAMEVLSDAIAAGAVRELRRFRPSADLTRPAAFTLVRFEELETITAQDVHDTALRVSAENAAPLVIKNLAILTFSKAAKALLEPDAEKTLVLNETERLDEAVTVLRDSDIVQATQALAALVAGVASMVMITGGRP